MESFRPNNWGQPDAPTRTDTLTTRASLAELEKWGDVDMPSPDMMSARQVEVADRAAWEAGRAALSRAFNGE